MTHICNWQKNYPATYLGLVPVFEERSECVFSPSILDVDIGPPVGGEDSRIADRDIQRGGGWKERTAAADKTTTSPHSCTSHRRAGGRRAQRLLLFRFWVNFEEIYL